MNPDIVQQLILAVGLALISIFGLTLRSLVQVGVAYLNAKIGQARFAEMRDYATTTVKAFEQSPIYKDLAGDKKKELVKLAILQYAQSRNLPIDAPLYDKFIEAAVQEMNSQMVKIDWTAIAEPIPGMASITSEVPPTPATAPEPAA